MIALSKTKFLKGHIEQQGKLILHLKMKIIDICCFTIVFVFVAD